jgi:hypothetical protein
MPEAATGHKETFQALNEERRNSPARLRFSRSDVAALPGVKHNA